MKLYYSPGACSLSPHIVLREAGIDAECEVVDVKAKVMQDGSDFRDVNPKGAVPTLLLDDGAVLTEGPAIIQYLADLRPGSNLAPEAGSMDRYRLQEWLNFIATDIHRTLSPLFSPTVTAEIHAAQSASLSTKLDYLNKVLADRDFLMGDQFTVADAYLFNILSWTIPTKIDISPWENVKAYHARVASRPAVRVALKEEGLIQ